jgi:hypothetical protein
MEIKTLLISIKKLIKGKEGTILTTFMMLKGTTSMIPE